MNRCCDDYTGECNGGRNCPARASTHWCETSRQPCTQPFTCASGCQIKAFNAELDPVHVWSITPVVLFLGCLVFWLFAAATFYFLSQ